MRVGARPPQVAKQTPTIFLPVKESEMLKKFMSDETGLELSEYAIAAALITLGAVGAITLLGTNISDKINSLANTVK